MITWQKRKTVELQSDGQVKESHRQGQDEEVNHHNESITRVSTRKNFKNRTSASSDTTIFSNVQTWVWIRIPRRKAD